MNEPRYVKGGLVTSDGPRVHSIRDNHTRKIIGLYTYHEMLEELERLNDTSGDPTQERPS